MESSHSSVKWKLAQKWCWDDFSLCYGCTLALAEHELCTCVHTQASVLQSPSLPCNSLHLSVQAVLSTFSEHFCYFELFLLQNLLALVLSLVRLEITSLLLAIYRELGSDGFSCLVWSGFPHGSWAVCVQHHENTSPVFPHRHYGNLRVTSKISPPSPLHLPQQLAKHALQTCRAYLCSLSLEHIFPGFIFSTGISISNGGIIRCSSQPQWW